MCDNSPFIEIDLRFVERNIHRCVYFIQRVKYFAAAAAATNWLAHGARCSVAARFFFVVYSAQLFAQGCLVVIHAARLNQVVTFHVCRIIFQNTFISCK